MLFEVLGDIWVIQRNPYLQEDMLFNMKRRELLVNALYHRIKAINQRNDRMQEDQREKIKILAEKALITIEKFKSSFERSWDLRRIVQKSSKSTQN